MGIFYSIVHLDFVVIHSGRRPGEDPSYDGGFESSGSSRWYCWNFPWVTRMNHDEIEVLSR